ncbi:cytochrome c5 family protein [Marinomonas sp. CT5]|uniref:c-type cytochrome n=1 Tax=Marinomonas sp. CT5 TaxID=2066133 RepID=UPI0020165637|nr:cytochrome c5 family protein [Marinomonas sp. CT5]
MLNDGKPQIRVFICFSVIYPKLEVEDNLLTVHFSILLGASLPMQRKPFQLSISALLFSGLAMSLVVSESAQAARSGESLFNSFCIACHMNGVAGAPKFGNKADWQPRIEKGIDTLLNHATTGFKAMPPKGLCANCTEDELRSAIQYMIDKSSDS